jgi:hypothetical protein
LAVVIEFTYPEREACGQCTTYTCAAWNAAGQCVTWAPCAAETTLASFRLECTPRWSANWTLVRVKATPARPGAILDTIAVPAGWCAEHTCRGWLVDQAGNVSRCPSNYVHFWQCHPEDRVGVPEGPSVGDHLPRSPVWAPWHPPLGALVWDIEGRRVNVAWRTGIYLVRLADGQCGRILVLK